MINIKNNYFSLLTCISIFIFSIVFESCAQSDKKATKTEKVQALSKKFIAPTFATNNEGVVHIPGWTKVSTELGSLHTPKNASAKYDPHLFQITTENKGYNVDTFFDYLGKKANLKNIKKPIGVTVDGYFQIFGKMLACSFGEAEIDGQKVYFFMDLLGPDFDNTILGNVVYAKPEVFESWHGALFPLVLNGYVESPDIFTNEKVFQIQNFENSTQFYAAMINTKLNSEYSSLMTLSNEAMRAMKNATVIAGCAASDNCEIGYDAQGNAVEEYH